MLRSGGNLSFRRLRSYALICEDESLTLQSERDGADINIIMDRALKTGMIPLQADVEALVGDFSEVGSYQDLQDLVLRGTEEFMKLPPNVRARFSNSPQAWLDYLDDPKNVNEMIAAGHVKKREPVVPPPPMKVEVVNAPKDDK